MMPHWITELPQEAMMTYPTATGLDAADDSAWFGAHPERSYRLRKAVEGWWIIERRTGGELLRTWAATIGNNLPDTDKALGGAAIAARSPSREVRH
jgi:hypothetical protein